MPDPVSRLQLAHDEINKTFGVGFAEQHPEVVVAVMQSAASDWAAIAVARALQSIADALLVEDEPAPGRLESVSIVRADGVLRP
jgi:hypothetical protein